MRRMTLLITIAVFMGPGFVSSSLCGPSTSVLRDGKRRDIKIKLVE